ncbi:sensor domain-containing diguanylate cyclase [Telmatospirillum siberiense]|uniref:GGDEF domain-containing protein n=1 Tax=Telmatospirillum siberiense TaxID=382514 RepID=A0A2N3PP50_9PROT|nr:sensor domain-containing diguanylate cyclase [Telmatospirillum siberiense]PKU22189.1 GGDEF domain-containing protein [Telmatospirillum siberiense]
MARFFRLQTLGARLVLFIVTLVVAGVVAELVFLAAYMRSELIAQASSQLTAICTYVARSIDRDLIVRREMLENLAEHMAGSLDGDYSSSHPEQGRLDEANGLFRTGVELVDATGKRLAAVPDTLGADGDGAISGDFLERAVAKGFALGRPVIGLRSGVAQIAMAVPVRRRPGREALVLVGVTPLRSRSFLGALYDTHLGQSGGFVLVSPRDGIFLGASDDELALRPVPPAGLHHQHDLAMRGIFGVGVDRRVNGVEEVAATVPIPSAGWFVVARIPTGELFASIAGLSRHVLTLGAIAVALVAMGGFVVLRLMLRPLHRSAALADRMSREEIPFSPLPVERDDEVGHLTFAFNRLLATLLDSREDFKRQALCDGLTGLANRVSFDQAFARYLSRARRHHTKLAVLFLDLDGFKRINDGFGHEVGDAALKAVAQRLSQVLRQEDVLARLGGDEFAVLLGDLVDAPAEVAVVADHCRGAMAAPVRFNDRNLAVGLSIGQACFPDDGETAEELLAVADQAMYRDKQARAAPGRQLVEGGN